MNCQHNGMQAVHLTSHNHSMTMYVTELSYLRFNKKSHACNMHLFDNSCCLIEHHTI